MRLDLHLESVSILTFTFANACDFQRHPKRKCKYNIAEYVSRFVVQTMRRSFTCENYFVRRHLANYSMHRVVFIVFFLKLTNLLLEYKIRIDT